MLSLGARLDRPEIAIEEALYQMARDHRGAIPGIIQDVNTSPNVYGNTVNVDIALNEVVIDDNGNAASVKIDTLKMVKLATLGAGGYYITMPVAVGDECMLIFQDMCLDAAWQGTGASGINNPQLTKRRHALSDAICVPLRWTQKNALSGVSNTSLQIRSLNDTTYIDITNGQVTIYATTVQLGTGSPQALMANAFYAWFVTNIEPFLVSKGYAGVGPPTNSLTVNLKGS